MTKIKEEEFAPFAVIDVEDLQSTDVGKGLLERLQAAGVQFVTKGEMRYLKEMSWGPDAYRQTCEACDEVMVFERHPADWPNHPGDPTQEWTEGADGVLVPPHVRVAIECPRCGLRQFTDGVTEHEYSQRRLASVYAEVMEEVARRLQEENGGEPVRIDGVTATDVGNGGDNAAGG